MPTIDLATRCTQRLPILKATQAVYGARMLKILFACCVTISGVGGVEAVPAPPVKPLTHAQVELAKANWLRQQYLVLAKQHPLPESSTWKKETAARVNAIADLQGDDADPSAAKDLVTAVEELQDRGVGYLLLAYGSAIALGVSDKNRSSAKSAVNAVRTPLAKEGYPAWMQLECATRVVGLHVRMCANKQASGDPPGDVLADLGRLLATVLADPSLNGTPGEEVVDEWIRNCLGDGRYAGQLFPVLEQALASPGANPWLAAMVRARLAYARAVGALDGEPLPEAATEGQRAFQRHIAQARAAFEDAWKLDPHRRGAATGMLLAQFGHPKPATALWLERAWSIEMDCPSAFLHAIRLMAPSWGGTSRDDMLALANRARNSNRWDTEMPLNYLEGIYEICADQHRAPMPMMIRDPAVWAQVKETYDRLAAMTTLTPFQQQHLFQVYGALACAAGKMDEGKDALEQVKGTSFPAAQRLGSLGILDHITSGDFSASVVVIVDDVSPPPDMEAIRRHVEEKDPNARHRKKPAKASTPPPATDF